MNASTKWRGYGVCSLALFLVCALALLPAFARAEDGANNSVDSSGDSKTYSALPAAGSITLLLTSEAYGSGATMTGGRISLYCVASVNREDPHDRYYDVLGGQFASCEAVAGIRSMDKQELDAQNPAISAALDKEAADKSVEPLQTVAIVDGEASFPKVEEGLYLIVQTEPSDAQREVQPFVMSVPNEQGELHVVATPKPGAWDGIDPGAPKEQQESKNSEDSEEAAPAAARTTPATTGASSANLSVPATGDRTSWFALAAAAGIALVLLGRRVCVKRNEHE